MVQRWQSQLASRLGHDGVMAARSLLYRILQAAENEGHIGANPIRKVRAPKRPIDPEIRFGRARRRTVTPEEFGRLLAASVPFYRDHLITQVGTGLRSGELLGLRAWRINPAGHLEVLTVRYEAGKFGTGYKDRPKSDSSIRPVPLCEAVAAAVKRRLAETTNRTDLVFPGPGGSNGVARGQGVGLSVRNYRRAFKRAVEDADLAALGLDLHGPHDLRATFATWLEGAAIPTRVIDELMGHASGGGDRGTSRMGALYRETTPEMLARVTAALDERLAKAEQAAVPLMPEMEEKRRARLRRQRRSRRPRKA
jgi:integrase